jgi:hypothetical protein
MKIPQVGDVIPVREVGPDGQETDTGIRVEVTAVDASGVVGVSHAVTDRAGQE